MELRIKRILAYVDLPDVEEEIGYTEFIALFEKARAELIKAGAKDKHGELKVVLGEPDTFDAGGFSHIRVVGYREMTSEEIKTVEKREALDKEREEKAKIAIEENERKILVTLFKKHADIAKSLVDTMGENDAV